MRKLAQVQLPKIEEKLTLSDKITSSMGNRTMSTEQIRKMVGNKSTNHIRSELSHMVRDGKLESLCCDKCDVGVMYRVKK